MRFKSWRRQRRTKRGQMTTALLLIVPVIGSVLFGAVAKAVIVGRVAGLEPVAIGWPAVVEAPRAMAQGSLVMAEALPSGIQAPPAGVEALPAMEHQDHCGLPIANIA